MDFRMLPMRKSPFHDDNLSQSKGETRKTIRLPNEAYNQLNSYFEANNLDFSKGIRSLCYDKLDMICNERKTFNNLECFMLIPKINLKDFDLNDMKSANEKIYHILNTYSEIIAIVNTEWDFESNFNHVGKFNDDYNLGYEMKEFNAENFPMHILQNTKDSCVYRIHKGGLNSFYDFKDRLSVLFYDRNENSLNVDDCYFVRFPLNNYLDKFRNGQFQQEAFLNTHEGIYAFEMISKDLKHYCFIDWSYSHEAKNIDFEIYFVSADRFLSDVYDSRDEKLIKSALDIVTENNHLNSLKEYKQKLIDEIDFVNRLLEDKTND